MKRNQQRTLLNNLSSSPHKRFKVLPTARDVDDPFHSICVPSTSPLPYDNTMKAFSITGILFQGTYPSFTPVTPIPWYAQPPLKAWTT